MSGLYIPNMEMPKEGQEILISAGITGTVYARLTPSEECVRFEKDCWHKVIPVPDHKGPLIDVVELLDTFDDDYIFTNDQAKALFHHIIPAESGDSG